jgi:hypothetical protein
MGHVGRERRHEGNDLTCELTVNSMATATGAVTPLFVTGKVTRDACD